MIKAVICANVLLHAETVYTHIPTQNCLQRKMKQPCKFKERLQQTGPLWKGHENCILTPLSKNQRSVTHFLMLIKTNVQSFKNVGEIKSITLHTAYIQYRQFPDFVDKQIPSVAVFLLYLPHHHPYNSQLNSFKSTISNTILWISWWKTLLYMANTENASTRDCISYPED